MDTTPENPIKSEDIRNPDGTFKVGNPGSPGRPKGKTLKDFAREFFQKMSDPEKQEFLQKLAPDMVWRMAEGNPAQDLTSGGEKLPVIPIYGGQSIPKHDSDSKDIQSV